MLISYKNIDVRQGNDLILADACLEVSESEFVYVIGKVGSGKSSLLKTMYCELDIDRKEGSTAEVLGRNLLSIKRKEIPALRREMGIIFQDFQLLFDRDVFGNLEFVLRSTGWKKKADIEERIDKVLEQVGMSEKKYKRPHELSGGEQQRIAIARALLNSPKIIIADEPTGNLDQETAENIVALLKDITNSGTAVVMSTHNKGMIGKFPGSVYQCGEGKFTDVTLDFCKQAHAQA